jgi:O-succinylbenzoic acid--CoA ligase
MKPLRVVDPKNRGGVILGLREALDGGDALCVSESPIGVDQVPDDCAVVVLTSGSTATPKRVALSAAALKASARATANAIGSGNWVLALPVTYIAGLMVMVRALEAETDTVEYGEETFLADAFERLTANLPAGDWYTSLVPAQLSRLVDAAELGVIAPTILGRYLAILVGGQAIPPGLIDRATALGARIVRSYGSAETAGGVVYDGLPIGDAQLRLTDDGILEISSTTLASGYIGDDTRTAASFVDGWFRTTDRARFDDGRLVIEGRVDDIIVSGGVKVSLADIERVLAESGIDAVASWFPDDGWGQVPALVSTKPVDLDEVRRVVEAALGKAARPYRAVIVDTIPTLSSGKVDRIAVHEIVRAAQP